MPGHRSTHSDAPPVADEVASCVCTVVPDAQAGSSSTSAHRVAHRALQHRVGLRAYRDLRRGRARVDSGAEEHEPRARAPSHEVDHGIGLHTRSDYQPSGTVGASRARIQDVMVRRSRGVGISESILAAERRNWLLEPTTMSNRAQCIFYRFRFPAHPPQGSDRSKLVAKLVRLGSQILVGDVSQIKCSCQFSFHKGCPHNFSLIDLHSWFGIEMEFIQSTPVSPVLTCTREAPDVDQVCWFNLDAHLFSEFAYSRCN